MPLAKPEALPLRPRHAGLSPRLPFQYSRHTRLSASDFFGHRYPNVLNGWCHYFLILSFQLSSVVARDTIVGHQWALHFPPSHLSSHESA